jgi:hypothetical protein
MLKATTGHSCEVQWPLPTRLRLRPV